MCGSAKIVSTPDSIGLPVFSAYGSNQLWVPETDGDFRITRFIALSDDVGLTFDSEIPDVPRRRLGIGDYCPIPYWIAGQLRVVSGDAYPNQVIIHHGASDASNVVVADLRRLLDDARAGRFALKLQADEADQMEASFPDLFVEAPVHSKYWVSRYRLAVANARDRTQAPHAIDERLLSLGRQWIERFGTKTDYPRLRALLGKVADRVYTQREICALLFVFIVDRINQGQIAEIVKWVLNDREFEQVFPDGIYGYFIKNGWPNAPFTYDRPKDILAPIRNAITFADTAMLSALRGLAYVYFGKSEAPQDFSQNLFPLRSQHVERLRSATSVINRRNLGSDVILDDEVWQAILQTVDSWDALRWLDGIDFPAGRRHNLRTPIRKLPAEYIDELRNHIARANAAAQQQRLAAKEANRILDARYAKYGFDTDYDVDESNRS